MSVLARGTAVPSIPCLTPPVCKPTVSLSFSSSLSGHILLGQVSSQKGRAPYRCSPSRGKGPTAQITVDRPAIKEDTSSGPSTSTDTIDSWDRSSSTRPLRVLVAGGGIGGLVFALSAKNKGMDVTVFERDLSAVRGEGQYRGPIQIQSNALAALEAVDPPTADEVMAAGCVTGDRVNGLVDGVTGEWYIKFDTFTPAAEGGLPITRVISRMELQSILSRAVGPDIVINNSTVVGFEDKGTHVTALLADGTQVSGDVLVGADGIWSRVRGQLLGPSEPTYSGYTCYTGICDYTPADLDTVGYRVFLGNKQYFVSSDVGHGKMQWYGFHKEDAGGRDAQGTSKQRLQELFGHWCENVTDLIAATPEEVVLRRDIYDRVPIFQWSRGRVTLLGDSAHAMQPNLGQGGCMAIEDGYQLAVTLEAALAGAPGPNAVDIPAALLRYQDERRLRVGAIHGLARMAAVMATTYKAYFGEGLGPLSWLTKLRIPHYGRVMGRLVMRPVMPAMLGWVLGGNSASLQGRAPSCRIDDRANSSLQTWLEDDDALERATRADWMLVPSEQDVCVGTADFLGFKLPQLSTAAPTVLGASTAPTVEGVHAVAVAGPGVSPEHARVDHESGAFFISDLKSQAGTFVTRVDGSRITVQERYRLHPGDTIELGDSPQGRLKIKLRKSE